MNQVASSEADLISAYVLFSGSIPAFDFVPITGSRSNEDGAALLTVSGHEVVILRVAERIPEHEMAGVIESSWTFPGAASAAGRHRQHAVVATRPLADDAARRRAAAQAISTVVSLLHGDAVYCPSAGIIVDASEFPKAVNVFDEVAPPVAAWVGVSPRRSANGHVSAASRGLATFVGYEISIEELGDGDGRAEVGAVYGLANWLLTSLPDLADGHTVAIPDGSTLVARRPRDDLVQFTASNG